MLLDLYTLFWGPPAPVVPPIPITLEGIAIVELAATGYGIVELAASGTAIAQLEASAVAQLKEEQ